MPTLAGEKKKNGGARPGAGRKPGWQAPQTLDKIALRARIFARVAAEIDPLLDSQIAAAKGTKYLVTRGADGKFTKVTEAMALAWTDDNQPIIEVWEEKPSTPAFTDLMNRAADKPIEPAQDVNLNANVSFRWATPGEPVE